MSPRLETSDQPSKSLSRDVSTADFLVASQLGKDPLPTTANWRIQAPHQFQVTKPTAVLQGWKAIAVFLERGVRTVQRWERTLGLPVHRMGASQGPVIAFRDELDSWLKACSRREHSSNIHQYASNLPCSISTAFDVLYSGNPGAKKLAPARRRGRENRENSKTRLPELVVASQLSKCPELKKRNGKCEICHSPLRLVDAVLSASSLALYCKVVLSLCPICDVELTGVQKLEKCS